MKKIIVMAALAAATVFGANTALAQSRACQDVKSLSIRPYIGLTGTSLMNAEVDLNYQGGAVIGVDAQYMFNKWFGLSAGLEALNGGWQYDEGLWDGSTATVYTFGVPVLANFYVVKGLDLKLGFKPTFVTGSDVTDDFKGHSHDFSGDDELTSSDVNVVFGISYEFKRFVLELRENVCTSNLFKHDDHKDAVSMGHALLTLGYRF